LGITGDLLWHASKSLTLKCFILQHESKFFQNPKKITHLTEEVKGRYVAPTIINNKNTESDQKK